MVEHMKFIALVKFKGMPTRDEIAMDLGRMEAEAKAGITYLSSYWTLGRYDAVLTFEAPDERAAMAVAMHRKDVYEAETLVAVPAEEASRLVK